MQIALALSGGIDSSAAAWLLKNQNWQVTGITMRHFSDQEMGFLPDKGIESVIIQAKKVCDYLNIPHIVLDTKASFSQEVIHDFINEYKSGRTPNPCPLCNRMIKWGNFRKKIKALGFTKIATGHYIRLQYYKGKYHLFKGIDLKKDQSYMLWQLDQSQLVDTVFPLAKFTKEQAREIIKDNNIPVNLKKESQEICFIKNHYEDFLKNRIKFVPGNIALPNGKIIGKHHGLPLYTVGQRKGIHTKLNEVLYVKKLDTKNNALIVTPDPDDLLRSDFWIDQVNWIADSPLSEDKLYVQIRYNSNQQEVKKLEFADDRIKVLLKQKARAVSPGQSAVFYRNDELIGGGIILS